MRFWVTLTIPVEVKHISDARKEGDKICTKLNPMSYVSDIETAPEWQMRQITQKGKEEEAIIWMKICSDCGGTGIKDEPHPPDGGTDCPRCKGTGEHVVKEKENT